MNEYSPCFLYLLITKEKTHFFIRMVNDTQDSTTFVRAQAVHQTLERQLMSCISMCARIAQAKEKKNNGTCSSTTTITGEQVRVVRTLLQKMSDKGDHLLMPLTFENDDEVKIGETSATQRFQESDTVLDSKDAWGSHRWKLPAFLLFAEEKKTSFDASIDFAKMTRRITKSWETLSREEQHQWKKKAYDADQALAKKLAPSTQSSDAATESTPTWGGGETKQSFAAPAVHKEPLPKTKKAVLDQIYNLEGGRPPKKPKKKQPSRENEYMSAMMRAMGSMGMNFGNHSPGRWCENCQEYHQDY